MSNQILISQEKSLFSQIEFMIEGKIFSPKKTNRALLAELAEWRKKVEPTKKIVDGVETIIPPEIPAAEIAYTCLEIYFGKHEEIDNLDPKEAGRIFEELGGVNSGKKTAAESEKDAEKNGLGLGVDVSQT
jgi:hypothetical protein